MPNNKWDDENIENLLKDFPAIKDGRSKEEVYKRLQKTEKPQKKSKHWIPYLVAALAFITFGVLLASMLGQSGNESAFDKSGDESEGAEESAAESRDAGSAATEDSGGAESESATTESSEEANSEEGSDSFNAMESAAGPPDSTLYEEQLEGFTLFTVGMTENAVVIPVSFVIRNDQLEKDFGTVDVDSVQLYNRYAAELDEEALGFEEYHPYSGTVNATADSVQHELIDGHNYDMASASMNVYFNSLSATFADANEISIIDDSGNPAYFDQVGPVLPIDPGNRNLAYYSYSIANADSYLVPGYDMPHNNATAALEAMKSSPSDLYDSVVPSGLDYSISENDQTVTVEFAEPVDFNSYEHREAVYLIEGMVLAADSFGKELVLANTADTNWDKFDFTRPLPVPAGINVKNFNY